MITSSLNALPPMLAADLHSTSSSNTFLAMPGTDSCHPEIGVGYVGATHSTYQEILEEALYLANLLNIRVLGVIPSSFCCRSTKCAPKQTVEALFSIWSSFLSQNPSGKFVQYFFGNGVYLIEEALSLFAPPPLQYIVFIGVNSDRKPSFPCQLVQSSFNPCRSGRSHNVLLLPTSPDSQGIFCQRFNDLTFSPALLDLFFKVTKISNNKDLSCLTDVTTPKEVSHFDLTCPANYLTELSKDSEPELFLRANQITQSLTNLPRPTWPQECLNRAVNLSLNCLRISSYISLLLKTNIPISSETLEMKSHHNQSISERYPNGTFPNGLLFNGTFPENGSYPSCIYPCGITPNGNFTMVTPITNIFDKLVMMIDESTKSRLDSHYHHQYPYHELLSEDPPWLVKSGINNGLYPCNVSISGVIWQGDKKSTLDNFSYKKFFSGDLINETLGIYPSNIYPNGTFGNCPSSFSEPYGEFKERFPYQSFFNANFSHENRFVANLNKTYLQLPERSEQLDFITSRLGGNHSCHAILTSYWLFNSLSQLVLISYSGSSNIGHKLKAVALGFASTTLGISVIDLCYNVRQVLTYGDPSTLSSHSLLIAYDGVHLAHEIISFSSPWIKSKALQVAEKATKIKGICSKNNILQIKSSYQKSLQDARITLSLFGLLLVGLLAVTIHSQHRFSKNTSASLESTFLSIFTGSMACMFLLFLYSVNKRG